MWKMIAIAVLSLLLMVLKSCPASLPLKPDRKIDVDTQQHKTIRERIEERRNGEEEAA